MIENESLLGLFANNIKTNGKGCQAWAGLRFVHDPTNPGLSSSVDLVQSGIASYKSSAFLESLVHSIRYLHSKKQPNYDRVAWLAHIGKEIHADLRKNAIAFELYLATWKALSGTREGVNYLRRMWGGCWEWWMQTAIARQNAIKWKKIIGKMKEVGFNLDYEKWPTTGSVLFKNHLLTITTSGDKTQWDW